VQSDSLPATSGKSKYVWRIGLTTVIGGFLFGYDTGVIGGALPHLEKYFAMDARQLGFSVAIVFVGSIFGAITGGLLSDNLGRRRTLVVTALMFLVSAVYTAFANTVMHFNIARFIGGVGIGVALPVAGVYLAEISPARVRGRMVSLNQLAITFGILVSYITGSAVGGLYDDLWQLEMSWRWAFGTEAVPAIAFLVLLFTIPESPRWLLQKGRDAAAMRVLMRIDGSQTAQCEIGEIKQVIAEEDVSLFQLFKPGLRIALIIGVLLSLFDQVTGINIVIYYIQKILLDLGFNASQARWGMIGLGVVNFTTTIVALALIDRVGRKPLLMFCPIGMSICMFMIGLQFYSNVLPPVFVLVFIMVYCFCYALGVGPGILLLLSEIFPTHIRGKAAGFCTIFMWVSCYFIAEKFPVLLEWSQSGTFGILGCNCLVMFFFVWLVVPETKNRTLEDIEKSWSKKQ
jgi:SP family arabinose:H+ symporter-like MFS transporter